VILNLLTCTVAPPFFSFAWGLIFRAFRRRRGFNFYLGWVSSAGCGTLSFLIQGPRVWAPLDGANVCLAVFLWWLSRRRRKRAPRAYGAKSRALVAAVVARMRETLKPRPILRPVPGGAS
jgi:hypothetical protein